MKRFIRICSLVLLATFVITSISPTVCFARKREKYQQELTDNPQLAEANEIYKRAIRYIEKGDGLLYRRPGEAAQLYSNAESYFNNAAFKLKEISYQKNVDVSKEIEFCKQLERKAHVKYGKARKEAKHD